MKHNWEYKPIGDCFAYIKNGANIKQEKEAGGLPVTRIETLSNGVFNRSKMGYANIFEIGKYEPNVLNNGDLLMSHINSKTYVGRTVIYESLPNEVIIHGMNLLRLIPNDAVRSKFFYYTTLSHYFKSKIVNIRKDSVNQSSFSISDLKKISIPVPPMEVQERIVAELDKINETIEDCRELLRNLDALAQSLFYDIFGDPITNPKGWQTQVLSEIAPQHPYKGKFSVDDDLWLLNLDMIEKNTGRIINRHKVKYEDIGNSVYKIGPNQVLYSKLRPNLNKVVIADDFGYCTSELLPLNPHKGLLNCQYLAYLLRTKECVTLFSGKVAGAKMPRTDLKTFRTFQIPIPPFELQEKFSVRIEQIEAEKKHVEATIAELQTLLASRMDYWFN